MVDLGTLGGGNSLPTAINNNGQVTGYSTTINGESHAFIWSPGDTQLTDLGTLGGNSSFPYDISDNGQVVGYGTITSGEYHPFRWSPGDTQLTDLGTFWGSNFYAFAYAINNNGQVVGFSDTSNGEQHVFSWTQAGGMVDLGTLGGSYSWVFYNKDLAENGQVAGMSSIAGDGVYRAFSWSPGDTQLTDLGSLGGSYVDVAAINEYSQAVGMSSLTGDLAFHAALWNFSLANPDPDGDEVIGAADFCPTVAGTVYKGCPFSDITKVVTHITGAKYNGACGTDSNGKNINECKVPAVGAEVRIYDRLNADFISIFGTKKIEKENLNTVFESNMGLIASCVIDNSGACQVGEKHGSKYLVVTKLTDGSAAVYNGVYKEFKKTIRGNHDDDEDDNDDNDNDYSKPINPKYFTITKKVHFTKEFRKDGSFKYSPTKVENYDGSLLEIAHPEYVIWENNVELYPFILTSDSDWTADICLSVPTGYRVNGVLDTDGNVVATKDCVQTLLAGESKTFLFKVTDVASPRPDFGLNITTTHKGMKTKKSFTIDGVKRSEKKANDQVFSDKLDKMKADKKVKADEAKAKFEEIRNTLLPEALKDQLEKVKAGKR